ncbi:TNF receptor-associated factor 3-like [Mizuhopecten yessoensis]|uniref:TNF receptor-associated factor 3 n=1 Tax=Mizuhopecten yessoensis TaxID=6573 RepID=A0A210PQE8_MIZYE|nr:TNF receptor-associated factor 3-like [Mizuhopecten yessoensis]XP_021377894.1 TNF receptor-associated factor 3-like [Mizuhopecten yessoensis]XP_021377895.1 TNF receptor-associated factor 3-like [Mizuhopecten yessoensis]XP_021377896.1 TNF receptor-associated factor 3-like [Mizuhopecten yessoensis]OWF38676.1 TNF receptor-associated factor 3 [Mizuhopecten yessoensis]
MASVSIEISTSLSYSSRQSMITNPDPDQTNPRFVENEEKIELCTACQKTLWNAFQLPCGHHVCPNGLKRVHEKGRCMVSDCKTPCSENEIFPDACKRREVASLKVECGHEGCKKIVKWGDLESHEGTCDYRKVQCDHCRDSVKVCSMQKHKDEKCEQRRVECPKKCGVWTAAISIENHLKEECLRVTLRCPNECGIEPLQREKLRNHVNECTLRRIPCRFKDIGCTFEGLEEVAQKHSVDGLPHHLELIVSREMLAENATKEYIDEIQKTIQKLLGQSEEMKKIQQENQQLKKECQANKKSIQDMKKVLASQGETVINVGRQLEDKVSTDRVNEIKSDITTVRDTLQGTRQRLDTVEKAGIAGGQSGGANMQVVERAEKQIGLMDVRVCEIDLRLQLLETVNYSGALMWKIRDYSRRKREAIDGKTLSLYSQPFYTSQYGYKLCGRAYLNGDGSGKGTYLSFFVVIMKGDFDALLPWPFMLPITLMVLDQSETALHVRESFTPNPDSNSFRKPTTEMNVACGVPCFMQHTKLEAERYLKDDTIFLRAVVDCSKAKPMY